MRTEAGLALEEEVKRILEGGRIEKDWVPFEGPKGGTGWYNTHTNEVRYQDEKPDERGPGEGPGVAGTNLDPFDLPRPTPEELDAYIKAVREHPSWEKGKEAFDRAWNGGENTMSDHVVDYDEDGAPVFTDERQALHDESVRDLLNEAAASENPIGVILIGPPGAGKGWWEENYGDGFGREFTRVNSDDTKEALPEYDGSNASYVHDEASYLAKQRVFPEAVKSSHNILYDTVATSPGSTLEIMDELEAHGYDMRVVFVDVPVEKSVHNVVHRFADEGRFTPLDYVTSARQGSLGTFREVYERIGDAEKVGFYDNDVEWGEPPEPLYQGEEIFKYLRKLIRKCKDDKRRASEATRKARSRRVFGRNRALPPREGGVVRADGPLQAPEGPGRVSKYRVYISDPSQAPSGVEVQRGERGGLFYETTGATDEKLNVLDDLETREDREDVIRHGFGLEETSLKGLSEESQRTIVSALAALGKRGMLKHVKKFTTDIDDAWNPDREIFLDPSKTSGFYGALEQVLFLDPDRLNTEVAEWGEFASYFGTHNPSELYEQMGSVSHISMIHPAGTLIHEVGHAMHFGWAGSKPPKEMTDEEYWTLAGMKEFDDKKEKRVAKRVSGYAASNPHEFIAETFAAMMLGVEFDDDVMELYKKFKGPEVSQ